MKKLLFPPEVLLLATMSRLAAVIAAIKEGTATEVNLRYERIGDAGAVDLAAVLASNTSVTSLSLPHISMSTVGTRALATALAVHPSVTMLSLSSNVRPEGAHALADMLVHNRQLSELYLDRCALGDDGCCALAKALAANKTLRAVGLDGNGITTRGAQALADALAPHASLKELYLNENLFGDDGARVVANMLATNRCLDTLHMNCDEIQADGGRALANALQTNGALIEIDLGFNDQINQGDCNTIDRELAANKRRHAHARSAAIILVGIKRFRQCFNGLDRFLIAHLAQHVWSARVDKVLWELKSD